MENWGLSFCHPCKWDQTLLQCSAGSYFSRNGICSDASTCSTVPVKAADIPPNDLICEEGIPSGLHSAVIHLNRFCATLTRFTLCQEYSSRKTGMDRRGRRFSFSFLYFSWQHKR